MDIDLVNCPKCRHSVSNTSRFCTYCGETIPKGKPVSQIDEEMSARDAQSPDPLPPPLPGEASAADEMPEPQADVHTVCEDTSAQQNIILTNPESTGGLMQKTAITKGDNEPNTDTVFIETENPIKTVNDLEQARGAPESGLMELIAAETSEEKNPAPENIEIDEIETTPVIEAPVPSGKSTVENQNVPLKEESAVKRDYPEIASDVAVKPAVSEEEILLTLDAEIQPVLRNLPENSGAAADTESDTDPEETAGVTGKAATSGNILLGDKVLRSDVERRRGPEKAEAEAERDKNENTAGDIATAAKREGFANHDRTLKKEKLMQPKAEAAKRQKVSPAEAHTRKKQRKERAGVESSKPAEPVASILKPTDDHHGEAQGLKTETKMMGLLKKYEGQAIGINYDNSAEIKKARLVAANDEFFSVFVDDGDLQYSYPLKTIHTVIEGKEGVDIGVSEREKRFNAVIKVYPLMYA
jgi:hypothetical protein